MCITAGPSDAPAELLPEFISGETSTGRLPNGDWLADDRGVIRRIRADLCQAILVS